MTSSINNPFIEFDGISFRYDKQQPVISNFSFTIGKGEKIAIQGDSGQGKSTLIRLILGFELPDSGKINLKGERIDSDSFSKIRTSTAWLPQDLNIGEGTVENIISRVFEFTFNRTQKPEPSTIEQSLEALGLPDSVNQKEFRDLSTGQRQRVGLALCHLLDRPLMLLDEPTSALDADSRQKSIDLLFADPDRTIISTTHDPFWIEQCDKTVTLN